MSERMIAESRHKARKKYRCNAGEWVQDVVYDLDFTYAELRAIVKARRNNWCIMPGEEYIRQIQVENGKLFTWRAIPAMHEICCKYEIYDW